MRVLGFTLTAGVNAWAIVANAAITAALLWWASTVKQGLRVVFPAFEGHKWHPHENEDELFLVHKGRFTMEFRDRSVPVDRQTFATPVNFRPLEMGFDLSIHSGTKYLNGHDDIAAGCVIGRGEYVERIRHRLNHLGGSLTRTPASSSTGG